MDQKKFDIGEALSFGWETFKANIGFLILVLLIIWVVEAIFSVPGSFAYRNGALYVFNILSFLVGIFVSIAIIKVSLRYTYGQNADFTDLYTGYPYYLNMLGGSILYALIVIGGLILLIVPGIYWGIRYQFYGYIIIDQDLSPVEAIKKSGRIARGEWWHLLLFTLAVIGVNFLGALACGIGLFVTVPLTYVAHAYVYRRLAYAVAMQEGAMAPPPAMPQPTVPQPSPMQPAQPPAMPPQQPPVPPGQPPQG